MLSISPACGWNINSHVQTIANPQISKSNSRLCKKIIIGQVTQYTLLLAWYVKSRFILFCMVLILLLSHIVFYRQNVLRNGVSVNGVAWWLTFFSDIHKHSCIIQLIAKQPLYG